MSTSAKRKRILACLLAALALSACASAMPKLGAAARLAEASSRVADNVSRVARLGPACREAARRVAAVSIIGFFRPGEIPEDLLSEAEALYSSMQCPEGAMAAIAFGAADEARTLSLGMRVVDG